MFGVVRFARALLSMNLRSALEYRVAFVSGALFMAISDAMWIVFWGLFFARFPVVRGWTLEDVVATWAIAAFGFGFANGFFGASGVEGVRIIVDGRLDYHLSVPKNTMLHYLLSKLNVPSLGDLAFGPLVYLVVVRPDAGRLALFLLLGLLAAVIFVSFGTIVNATAFYAGNSENLAMQMTNALITFSTYPPGIFSAVVKVVLFAAIPAGFVTYLPVELLRDFDPARLAAVAAFAAGILLVAVAVFYRGLRRYESGNLVVMRG